MIFQHLKKGLCFVLLTVLIISSCSKNSVNGLQITNNLDLISWSYTKDLFEEQSDIVQEELDQCDRDEELSGAD